MKQEYDFSKAVRGKFFREGAELQLPICSDRVSNTHQRPNLFDYATKELSQDAFLCWLLKWADPACQRFSEALHEAGVDLIRLLSAEKKERLPERINSVEVFKQYGYKQYGYIDVLCKINEEDDDRTAILIEDKKGAQEHSNQLQRYIELVKKEFPEDRILPVYVQTEDQSDYKEVRKHGYAVIRRPDLLDGLEKHTMARQESDVLDGFIHRLRHIEDDVQSWKSTEPQDWGEWDAWKGFYMELQSKPSVQGGWGYVNNETGGFLGYWFGDWTHIGGAELYLQIEQGKLCFRISVEEENDRKALREYWHRAVIVRCEEEGICAYKPVRFGYGNTMTVVVVERDDWLMVRDGHVDVAATVERLEKCLEIVGDCVDISGEVSSLLTELWREIDSALQEEIPDLHSKSENPSDIPEETIKGFKEHGLYYPFGSGAASLGVVLEDGSEDRSIFFGVYCEKHEHRELYMVLKEVLGESDGEPNCWWPWWDWADKHKNLWSISRKNRDFLKDEESRRKYAKNIAQGLKPIWDAIKRADLA